MNEATGEAIGIHTNAGCSSGGGANWGCAIHNAGLQNALANPQGVCVPNILFFEFPKGYPTNVFPNSPMILPFTITAGDEEPLPNTAEVIIINDGVTEILSDLHIGGNQYEFSLPGFQCDDVVEYYFQVQGNAGTWVYFPYDAPNAKIHLVIGDLADEIILQEGFADGIPSGWSTSGLWEATESCMPNGECDGGAAAYFGLTSDCTYDNGSTVTGSLTTSQIPIDGYEGNIILSFCSALETENLDGYDSAELYVNGALIDELGETSNWQEHEYTLNVTGNTLQIEWRFDSGDSLYNEYRGWHIDGIQIVAQQVECDDTVNCPADINGDNNVNVSDLLVVIDQWGQSDSPADITGDGIVDVSDLLEVVGNWGACV